MIVLDSDSSDRTVELARKSGGKVYTRSFDDFSSQRNAAIALARREWVFFLDADERLSTRLASQLVHVLSDSCCHGYRVKRHLVYMGRKLVYGDSSDRPLRLIRRRFAHYEGCVHETLRSPPSVSCLEGELIHYSYKNLDDYFERFNSYTRQVADKHMAAGHTLPHWHFLRPWFEFVRRYFFRLGFLDGAAGYSYALNSSLYAFIKYEKLRELQLQRRRD